MPRFILRPEALVVEACVSSSDTTVQTEKWLLFGVSPGFWCVFFPDGTKKIMAHAEFIEMFEPADTEAAVYLEAMEGV